MAGDESFPRLYAAASLKHRLVVCLADTRSRFSAALCRGLIEADIAWVEEAHSVSVFRGFMPRPH